MADARISDSAAMGGLAHILPDVVSSVRRVRHRLAEHRLLGGRLDFTRAVAIFIETCLSAIHPDAFVL